MDKQFKNAFIEETIAIKDEILNKDPDVLTTNFKEIEKGGDPIKVSEIKNGIIQFQDLLIKVSREGLECLPEFRLTELTSTIKTIYGNLNNSLFRLKVSQSESVQQQKASIVRFFVEGGSRTDSFNFFRNYGWPIVVESITLLNNKEGLSNYDQFLKNIKENMDKALLRSSAALKQLETDVEQSKNLLQASKENTSRKTVAIHAEIFAAQSNEHFKNALKWKTASICLLSLNAILITVLFIAILYNTSSRVEIGIFGFLIVSLFSYAVVQCAKNFYSAKHNQIINKHKANCLDSYETFVNSADNEVREIVLRYTTQTIFAPFNPGYLSKETIQSPSPVFELLRTIQSEKPKTASI